MCTQFDEIHTFGGTVDVFYSSVIYASVQKCTRHFNFLLGSPEQLTTYLVPNIEISLDLAWFAFVFNGSKCAEDVNCNSFHS